MIEHTKNHNEVSATAVPTRTTIKEVDHAQQI